MTLNQRKKNDRINRIHVKVTKYHDRNTKILKEAH